MVGRGAGKGKAKRDVDGIVKAECLGRNERLIVIHAHGNIITPAGGIVEHGVGGQGAESVDPVFAQPHGRRVNHVAILGAERAVLARMRVETGNRQTRCLDDLARQAESLCLFLEFVERETGHKPMLVGYSNGAIIAAEAILQNRALSKAAILLRPLSPRPDDAFPPMTGYPALLIAAENDQRRDRTDAPYLARQFEKAGASIALKTVAGGHGWAEGDADIHICKAWLLEHCDG